MRAPGAIMAIAKDGRSAGYLSGGCIDADVVAQAQTALQSGQVMQLRYGLDSPFKDLQLPCNGALDVIILPHADADMLHIAHDSLQTRQPVRVSLDADGNLSANVPGPGFVWNPRLQIRIAGRGADCLALARLAKASGFPVSLSVRDGPDFAAAKQLDVDELHLLTSPTQLPPAHDDPWTAFALMFHEREWEIPLLQQALAGPAFYVGALGSPNTHRNRQAQLAQAGVPRSDILRIHAPIGLVPSLRDASLLAVSALAEIVDAWRGQVTAGFGDTGLLLLAAGLSTRYAGGDKLMADMDGKPLLAHAANALRHNHMAARLAVVGDGQTERQTILAQAGWDITINAQPDLGLASSLAAGLAAMGQQSGVQNVLILLADMPAVSDDHLRTLKSAMDADVSAVMSESDGVLMPPAIFPLSVLQKAGIAKGEQGARQVFEKLSNTTTIPLPKAQAMDVDTVEDLSNWRET